MIKFDSSLLSNSHDNECHAGVNIEAINTLAKLLANENLEVIHSPSAHTAMFSPETRSLVLPAWKDIPKLIYVLFSGHEIGHALWTPKNGFSHSSIPVEYRNKSGFKSLLNVTEDARIEKKVKRKYPGLRNDFMDGYKKLFQAGFFSVEPADIAGMNLADRINIRMKLGTWIDSYVPFHDALEQDFLDRARGLETFTDAVELAVDLYEHMVDEMGDDEDQSGECSSDGMMEFDPDAEPEDADTENTITQNGDDDSDDGDDDSDSAASSSDEDGDEEGASGEGDSSDEDDDSDEDGDSSDDGGSTGDEEDEKDSSGDVAEGSSADGNSDNSEYDPTAETDEAGRKNSEELRDSEGLEPLRLTAPVGRIDPATIVDDTKTILAEFRSTIEQAMNSESKSFYRDLSIECKKYVAGCKPVVAYLAKEFEMKKAADEHRRSSVARSGVLNVNTLHSYKYNEDIFLRKAIQPDAKNHGLVMFVDFSGSMASNMEATLEQLINLVLFCKKVAIPFEVYGFNDKDDYSSRPKTEKPKYKKGDVIVHGFSLRQYVTDKLNARDFKAALEYLFYLKRYHGGGRYGYGCNSRFNENTYYLKVPNADNLGSTPLNSAIIVGIEIVNNFRKSRGVQICNVVFLTDGESNPLRYYHDPSDERAARDGEVGMRSYSYTHNIYLFDEKTKKSYSYHRENSYSYSAQKAGRMDETGFLMTMMKDHCDVNVAGFYILPSSGARAKSELRSLMMGYDYRFNHDTDLDVLADSIYEDIKKEGVGIVGKSGYDILFVLKGGDKLKTSEESALSNVPDDATVANIRAAFKKGSKKKLKSRVLLTKFIDMIAA